MKKIFWKRFLTITLASVMTFSLISAAGAISGKMIGQVEVNAEENDPAECIQLQEGETVTFDYSEEAFVQEYSFIPTESGAYDLDLSIPDGEYEIYYILKVGSTSINSSFNSAFREYTEEGQQTDYYRFLRGEAMLAGVEYRIKLEAEPYTGANSTGWICMRRSEERIVQEMRQDVPVELERNLLCSFTAPEKGNYEIMINSEEGGTVDWNWGRITVLYGKDANSDSTQFVPNQQLKTNPFRLAAGDSILVDVYYNGSDTILSGDITIVKSEEQFSVSAANVSFTDGDWSYPFTGDPVEPEVQVSLRGELLIPGEDYEVSYEDNVNASGTSMNPNLASVTVSGIGDFKDSAVQNFVISSVQVPEENVTVMLNNTTLSYNGKVQTPTVQGVTVQYNGKEFQLSKEELAAIELYPYDDSIEPGEYSMSVNLYGNFFSYPIVNYTIGKGTQTVTVSKTSYTKTFGNAAFSLGAKTNGDGQLTYSSDNTKVATVSSAGKVTIKGAGTAKIKVYAKEGTKYNKSATKTVTVKVNKAANPITAKGKTASVKYADVKKASKTIKRSAAVSVSSAKGTVTYAKTSGNSKITVNKKTGNLTIKKGLAKGTYKVKIKVTAAGSANYKSASKTVTVTVKVK